MSFNEFIALLIILGALGGVVYCLIMLYVIIRTGLGRD